MAMGSLPPPPPPPLPMMSTLTVARAKTDEEGHHGDTESLLESHVSDSQQTYSSDDSESSSGTSSHSTDSVESGESGEEGYAKTLEEPTLKPSSFRKKRNGNENSSKNARIHSFDLLNRLFQ